MTIMSLWSVDIVDEALQRFRHRGAGSACDGEEAALQHGTASWTRTGSRRMPHFGYGVLLRCCTAAQLLARLQFARCARRASDTISHSIRYDLPALLQRDDVPAWTT